MPTPTDHHPKSLIVSEIERTEVPSGVDRRTFLMRSAVIGATAVITGRTISAQERTAAATAAPPLSNDLDVVKRESKGPVITTIDEFYKVGPGPSSSHTIGPMRITYDFYQRCTKLPAATLAKATALKVHLYGSLSATGKGHGTERAALAGIVGKEPATVDPAFLDSLAANPNQSFPVKLGDEDVQRVARGHHLRLAEGRLPAPEHDDLQAHGRKRGAARARVLLGRRRLHRVEGLHAAEEGRAEVPVLDDGGAAGACREEQPVDRAGRSWRTRSAVSGKTEAEVNAFIDKITTAMINIVKTGLSAPSATLPGPIKLKTKAGDVYKRAMDDEYEKQRGVGVVAAYALAGSEENARGHLVVTAPTGGSAGVMPALVYAVGEGGRKLPQDKIRSGMLAAAGDRLPLQAQRDAVGRRGRLPGGDRRRVRDGRGVPRAGARLPAAGRRERGRVLARAPPRHDVRPGRGLRAGAVHRALRVRRGEVVDRLHDREQRDPGEPARRLRHDRERDGADGEGDEHQVQGDVGRRPRRFRRALLTARGADRRTAA